MEGDNGLALGSAEDDSVPETVTEDVVDKVEGAEASDSTTPEGDKQEGEQPEGEGGEEPEKKNLNGSEKARRRLAQAQAEIDRMARELDELRKPKEIARDAKPGIDREPTEADFPNDYFAFERARTAWEVRTAIREETRRGQETRAQEVHRELQAARLEAYEENKALVRERIPDFDKVVSEARNTTVSEGLAAELLASDKSALLQYHLAKNPDKVRELNQMSGRELAKEIGRLEARVSLPQPKKATEAAPPPSQIKGKAAPPFDPHKSDDMEAYVAWRKKNGFGSR